MTTKKTLRDEIGLLLVKLIREEVGFADTEDAISKAIAERLPKEEIEGYGDTISFACGFNDCLKQVRESLGIEREGV